MNKKDILKYFHLFSLGTKTRGIGNWLTENTNNDEIFNRLIEIDTNPLKKVQLNQLLVLGHQAPLSDGFFKYYWNKTPEFHPYPVKNIPGFAQSNIDKDSIVSLSHFRWGLYRLYTDALLYFGDVNLGYSVLREKDCKFLEDFFLKKRIDTDLIKRRGEALPLKNISQDKRYLISEMACKSYGKDFSSKDSIKNVLLEAYKQIPKGKKTTIRRLLDGKYIKETHSEKQEEFNFSTEEIQDKPITSKEDLISIIDKVSEDFYKARGVALANTDFYLSMVSDLDVYVATSMRNREDFREMTRKTKAIFENEKLDALSLRYFDPTLSASDSHEDKGLIECLMVKCSKVLVYCAGDKDSYGKDAEAAMALSLGKPVIFLCDQEQRSRFYKDIHPLSRLIDFNTGVVVGAMVTDKLEEVAELLRRFFENRMEYRLEHDENKRGYLRLKEKLTNSTIRLQTNNELLSSAFWNNYHRDNS